MAPFRAWRYSPQAGELEQLIAPPYDVVNPELQAALYARSPHNVVRVDLGVAAANDGDSDNSYTRSAAMLADWKREGVLVRDTVPTITFVEEAYTGPDGVAGRRHGLLAALRLTEFGQGVVFPHEHTLTGPKEDRFRLMTATAMSLSPVFLLYDLPGDDLTSAWKTALGSLAPTATTVDELGNLTRLWPSSDPALLALVAERLAASRFLIADGHHRYETALRYQKARHGGSDSTVETDAAFDHCLVYLANMRDPGLAIYPTHRLVRGLSQKLAAGLPAALEEEFAVERLAGGAAGAQSAIAAYLQRHPRGAFGLWGPALEAPYGFRLVDPAKARVTTEHSAAYQELDVTVLQDLILERALGISASDIAAEKHLAFFKDSGEAFASLQAGEFQLGFFLNPTGLDQVCQVAFGGERMPQKTTFFYPKLPTGLVFHDLAGRL